MSSNQLRSQIPFLWIPAPGDGMGTEEMQLLTAVYPFTTSGLIIVSTLARLWYEELQLTDSLQTIDWETQAYSAQARSLATESITARLRESITLAESLVQQAGEHGIALEDVLGTWSLAALGGENFSSPGAGFSLPSESLIPLATARQSVLEMLTRQSQDYTLAGEQLLSIWLRSASLEEAKAVLLPVARTTLESILVQSTVRSTAEDLVLHKLSADFELVLEQLLGVIASECTVSGLLQSWIGLALVLGGIPGGMALWADRATPRAERAPRESWQEKAETTTPKPGKTEPDRFRDEIRPAPPEAVTKLFDEE